MNRLREKTNVKNSFYKIFGLKFPHLDTCQVILKNIDSEKLKTILTIVISYLINNKLFSTAKKFDRISIIVDGTGIGSVEVDENNLVLKPKENYNSTESSMTSLFPSDTNTSTSDTEPAMNTTLWATGKTSKNGIRYFGRQLVMLRMVGPNGMSIIVDWV